MKINSLKLTIQDVETADGKPIAAIMGTVFIEDGTFKKDINDQLVLDQEGMPIPFYETINFTTALSSAPSLKKDIQALIIEALTLKNLEIAKENGTLSHFVQTITGEKPKKGSRSTKPKRKK